MNAPHIRYPALFVAAAIAIAPSGAQAQKKQRDVITREEIMKSNLANGDLLTVVKVLRPQFFEAPRGTRSLGNTGMAPVAVYVDKVRQPDNEIMLQIKANEVSEVRYLDPNRSQNEYGITANGGAIVIKRFVQVSLADSLNKKPQP